MSRTWLSCETQCHLKKSSAKWIPSSSIDSNQWEQHTHKRHSCFSTMSISCDSFFFWRVDTCTDLITLAKKMRDDLNYNLSTMSAVQCAHTGSLTHAHAHLHVRRRVTHLVSSERNFPGFAPSELCYWSALKHPMRVSTSMSGDQAAVKVPLRTRELDLWKISRSKQLALVFMQRAAVTAQVVTWTTLLAMSRLKSIQTCHIKNLKTKEMAHCDLLRNQAFS